jgi:hypothetical protein
MNLIIRNLVGQLGNFRLSDRGQLRHRFRRHCAQNVQLLLR